MTGSIRVLRCRRFLFIAVVALSFLSVGAGEAGGQPRTDLRRVFARPLIVGASVSGGLMAKGPGDVATEFVMGTNTAVNIAGNGNKARDLVNIDAGRLAGYSLIIGVDLLFWDSTLADPAQSIAVLKNLIRSANRAGRPVVIGDVPQLIDDQIPATRAVLNQALYDNCRPQRRCYVLGLERLYNLARGPGLVIGPYTYRHGDLTVDGLHLNSVASDYVARSIIQVLGR